MKKADGYIQARPKKTRQVKVSIQSLQVTRKSIAVKVNNLCMIGGNAYYLHGGLFASCRTYP